MKTLILGMGNPILKDDGVGLRVAEELQDKIHSQNTTVMVTELGGINLLELLVGYDQAIIIDSIKTSKGKPGHIYRLSPESILGSRHTNSTHGIDFADMLKLGKRLGMMMPQKIVIFAVEAEDTSTFGEKCTLAVNRAISVCKKRVIKEIC
jgi:hydrogenase maturation protease